MLYVALEESENIIMLGDLYILNIIVVVFSEPYEWMEDKNRRQQEDRAQLEEKKIKEEPGFVEGKNFQLTKSVLIILLYNLAFVLYLYAQICFTASKPDVSIEANYGYYIFIILFNIFLAYKYKMGQGQQKIISYALLLTIGLLPNILFIFLVLSE